MTYKQDFKLLSAREIALELGKRLRAARLSQNRLQDDLAQRAGVSRLTVVHFEKSGRCSMESFLRMVMALGRITDLAPLFQTIPSTIADMEKATFPNRQRASRKNAS